ncbi:AMP-binding protein [uncultured Bradyrhizobium sp.]|uniref:AMP-binding protein n=1 Tax=uncultured Bradyrhizobium sp. TaxID=199684 RepID=UPI0035CA8DEE
MARVAEGGAPSAHAITFFQPGHQRRIALEHLDEMARRVAVYLVKLGVRSGDRIGILANNCLEWVLLDLAALKIKAVTAGFEAGKFAATPDLLDRYGLRLIFTGRPTDDRRILPMSAVLAATSDLSNDRELAPVVYQPSDVTTIKFTSGSTGQPKGLAATVGSIDSSITAVQQLFNHSAPDKLFVFLPLSLLQQRYWIYSALVFGHDVVVATYELAFQALKQEEPTVVMGVPAFFETLRKEITSLADAKPPAIHAVEGRIEVLRSQARELLGRRIRYLWTGSAPANPAMLQFFNTCGMPIFEGYGMNETCIVTKNTPDANRTGSVGRPLQGKKVFLDDDGVIMVESQFPVNTSYLFSAPGDSERIFRPGGVVCTGDIGRIDADGYLYVLGRADDIIVLANGRNVMVRKIEERLKCCAAISDCVLAGFGHDYLLAVVCAPDGDAARDEIKAHIAEINKIHGADEKIGRFIITDEPFSIENGLLTSQYKPRRKVILSRYQQHIERGYGELQ